jgi:hypothetical protein
MIRDTDIARDEQFSRSATLGKISISAARIHMHLQIGSSDSPLVAGVLQKMNGTAAHVPVLVERQASRITPNIIYGHLVPPSLSVFSVRTDK